MGEETKSKKTKPPKKLPVQEHKALDIYPTTMWSRARKPEFPKSRKKKSFPWDRLKKKKKRVSLIYLKTEKGTF